MADMPPDATARMQAWQKYGTPGPEHATLALLAGRWKAAVKTYPVAGAPAMESRGDAEFETVLGGNFIEQKFRGDMGGMPFEGRGHIGYNRYTKEYFQTWLDSMSTSMLTLTGQADASGHVLSFSGTSTDVATGRTGTLRQTMRITPERVDLEMYGPGDDGREQKMMEIIYFRG